MGKIKLLAGDFGASGEVRLSDDGLYLPNPEMTDGEERVSFRVLAEVEPVANDQSKRLGSALKLSLSGLAAMGPVGLAAGALAVRKGKDLTFMVKLDDGRHFIAATDARTYADIRSSRLGARHSAVEEDDPAREAEIDRMIARYMEEHDIAAPPAAPEEIPLAPDAPPMAAAPVAEAAPDRPELGVIGRGRNGDERSSG